LSRKKKSVLFLVPTPIGNYQDITLRAIETLKEADLIICEEFKEAWRLFSKLGIEPKELISLNEHNEQDSVFEVISKIKEGEKNALISDAGSPVFSDPGTFLLQEVLKTDIRVVPLPGANSMITALIGSGFELNNFYFAGWLPQKKEMRRKALYSLKNKNELLILMETPYRLRKLLAEVSSVFGANQEVALAYNLTMDTEKFFRGKIGNISKFAEQKKLKGVFVLIIENRRK